VQEAERVGAVGADDEMHLVEVDEPMVVDLCAFLVVDSFVAATDSAMSDPWDVAAEAYLESQRLAEEAEYLHSESKAVLAAR